MDKSKNNLGDPTKSFKFAKEEKIEKEKEKEKVEDFKPYSKPNKLEVKEEPKITLTEEEINIAARKILANTNLFTARYVELPSYDKITLKTNALPANALKKLIDGYGMQALRATSDSLILFFPEGTLHSQLPKVEKEEKVEIVEDIENVEDEI